MSHSYCLRLFLASKVEALNIFYQQAQQKAVQIMLAISKSTPAQKTIKNVKWGSATTLEHSAQERPCRPAVEGNRRLCHVCFTCDPGVLVPALSGGGAFNANTSSVWIHENTDCVTRLFLALKSQHSGNQPLRVQNFKKTRMRVIQMSGVQASEAQMWILSAAVFENTPAEQVIIKQCTPLWVPPEEPDVQYHSALQKFFWRRGLFKISSEPGIS